jgi:TolB-like protein/DNA-binding winged helix-turn-helix (wHTH) protein/Tfp pilus assembly protein PilF
MEAANPSRHIVSFGAFEADLPARELRKRGLKIRLQDQPFQVLTILLERPGELITREELHRVLWPSDIFVDFDNSLNTAINKIRDALGDSAENPRFVETLPRRGYRFIAPIRNGENGSGLISELLPAQKPDLEATRSRPATAQVLTVLAVAIVLLVTLVGFDARGVRNRWRTTPIAEVRSLAVLPLENLSNDPEQEYFTDGMTDALITQLSQISALKVISRTSVMPYKKITKSLPQIVRELGVDAVVEGTVQHSGDRVRITAQLIHGATDKHIWAGSYERKVQDVLSLQEDIARAIADEISVKLTPQEQVRLAQTRPINLAAVEAYLQGQYHNQRARDMGFHFGVRQEQDEEFEKAIEYFQRSLAKDPNYAPTYVAMAEVWTHPGYPRVWKEANAREAIRKALEIDPTIGEAHADLGRIEFIEWNWAAAGQEFKRAIELSPNLAKAHRYYSEYLNITGHADKSMKEAEQTNALNPSDDQLAWNFYVRRQFDRFIEFKRSDIERRAFGPMAYYDLGYGYERNGMYPEAVSAWEQAMDGFGYKQSAEALRRGYSAGGFKGAMREWAATDEALYKKGEAIYPSQLAYIYGILGEKDRAFLWFEKSYEEHTSDMPFLQVDPTYDDLRSDPRFADLERRVGLPQ